MSRLALITFITREGVDIDNALPGGGYPSQGLPGLTPPVDPGYGQGRPNRPDQSLPWAPVRPDNGLPVGPPGSIGTLPVFPWDPTIDNSLPTTPGLPSQGLPGAPDNTLPGGSGGRPDNSLPPTAIRPGLKLVVKYLACVGLILVPDNSLPETAEPK